jgi:outer membrane lipoprotein LolB
MPALKTLLLVCLCLCAASCAIQQTPPPKNHTISWQKRRQQLEKIHRWQLSGKIAVRAAHKSITATLHWQQKNHRYVINLFGPLGLGAVEIIGQPGRIALMRANQPTLRTTSPAKLLRQQLGWQLPLSSLAYWIRSLPAPGKPSHLQFDRYHHVVRLDQQGWRIQYPAYTNSHGIDLPKKLILNNAYTHSVLVIYRWRT